MSFCMQHDFSGLAFPNGTLELIPIHIMLQLFLQLLNVLPLAQLPGSCVARNAPLIIRYDII